MATNLSAILPPEIDTPCLVVDAEILERNLRNMAAHARAQGIELRPHAKIHKCLPIARRQHELGAVGLTVATLAEAETFADDGHTNLFIGYPLWASGSKRHRLRALAERTTLRVGVDSSEGAATLASAVGDTRIEVLIEIDCGHHRTGVPPEQAGRVAVAATRAGLTVAGVFTFPGHGYTLAGRRGAALDESRALGHAASRLRLSGIDVTVSSGGSTPTATLADHTQVTELRPGVYVFNDAQQVELGAAGWDDIALTAAATVVSRAGDQLVLDAGSKVLGADQPPWATGGGRLPAHPHARVTALSEHHATVTFPSDEPIPGLGEVVRVAPNHVCAAVNLADELVIQSHGTIIDRWRVTARGRNT